MFSIDNNNKNDVSEAPNEAGTASLGILRNPPPPSHQKPLPQWAQNDAQTQRKDRFKALSAIRQILLSEGSKQFPLMPTKYHRSTLCKHSLTGSEVAVLLSNEHGKAFFDGLQTCGNVWTCPVCAAKVQERRRLEIAEGMEFSIRLATARLLWSHSLSHIKSICLWLSCYSNRGKHSSTFAKVNSGTNSKARMLLMV